MIDRQNESRQHQNSCGTLPQQENHLNSRPKGHSSLASILPPPRPSHLPLGGPRIVEFLGFRTGRNQFGRNTISFDFIDLNSQQIISRTVNIDQHLSDRSYFVKFTSLLVGNPQKFKEAAKGGGETLGTLINEQRGNKYNAECEPSRSGMHTNIVELRPLEAPRIDSTSRKGSTTSVPLG
jgi:hypothetical protein